MGGIWGDCSTLAVTWDEQDLGVQEVKPRFADGYMKSVDIKHRTNDVLIIDALYGGAKFDVSLSAAVFFWLGITGKTREPLDTNAFIFI